MLGWKMMEAKSSNEDLVGKAAYAMNAFYERTSELYHDVARSLGLSDSAFDILYALYAKDGQRQSELCKTSMMPKQTLASSVRKLEEQGLVRVKSEGRKVSRVFLTAAGGECAKRTIAPVMQAEVDAVTALPREVLEHLPETLDNYLDALDQGFRTLREEQGR